MWFQSWTVDLLRPSVLVSYLLYHIVFCQVNGKLDNNVLTALMCCCSRYLRLFSLHLCHPGVTGNRGGKETCALHIEILRLSVLNDETINLQYFN